MAAVDFLVFHASFPPNAGGRPPKFRFAADCRRGTSVSLARGNPAKVKPFGDRRQSSMAHRDGQPVFTANDLDFLGALLACGRGRHRVQLVRVAAERLPSTAPNGDLKVELA
jgi:hypothetical protein